MSTYRIWATCLVWALVATGSAKAINIDSEWFGGAGIWADEANWINSPDLGDFPNNGGGDEYSASITSPFSFVTSNTNIEVKSLTVATGTDLNLLAPFITNNLNFQGGTIRGTDQITVTGTATIDNSTTDPKFLDGVTFRNDGQTIFSGTGNLNTNNGATIDNRGLFEIQTDGNTSILGLTGTFINRPGAHIVKTAGTGTTFIDPTLDNQGTIEARSGTVTTFTNNPVNFDPVDQSLTGGTWIANNARLNIFPFVKKLGQDTTVKIIGENGVFNSMTELERIEGIVELLNNATLATPSGDAAFFTVVDRQGKILGVNSTYNSGNLLVGSEGQVEITNSSLFNVDGSLTVNGSAFLSNGSRITADSLDVNSGIVVKGPGNIIDVTNGANFNDGGFVSAAGAFGGNTPPAGIVINTADLLGSGFFDVTGGAADTSGNGSAGGDITINVANNASVGQLIARGGDAGIGPGNNGGKITLDITDGDLEFSSLTLEGSIDASGGSSTFENAGYGGNGGDIEIGGGISNILALNPSGQPFIKANGADGPDAEGNIGPEGANAGSVKITSTKAGTVVLGPIVANSGNGGAGNATERGGKGGDSGSIIIDTPLSDVTLNGIESIVGRLDAGPLGGSPGDMAPIELITLQLRSAAPINIQGGDLFIDTTLLTLDAPLDIKLAGVVKNQGGPTFNNSDALIDNSNLEGGGLWNNSTGATLDIANLSIANIDDIVNRGEVKVSGGSELNVRGGILNAGGNVTITDSILNAAMVEHEGGGLWNNSNSTLTIDTSLTIGQNSEFKISDGSDLRTGGGIFNNGGTVTLTDSTLNANSIEHEGGGLWNSSGGTLDIDTTLSIDNSELNASNGANIRAGGGIEIITGTISITDSNLEGGGLWRSDDGIITFTGNSIGTAGGGFETLNGGGLELDSGSRFDVSGGGIFIDAPSTLSIAGSTVTNNVATPEGGGIFNDGGTITITGGSDVSTLGDVENRNGGGIVIDNSLLSFGGFGNEDFDATVMITEFSTVELSSGLSNRGEFLIFESTISARDFSNSHGVVGVMQGNILINAGNDVTLARGLANSNGGSIDLDDSRLDVNGGGIFNDSTSTLTITDSTVTNNVATPDGGGIFNDGGTVNITGGSNVSTLGDVENRNGGGIVIDNSNVEGGGFWKNEAGTMLTLNDSTLKTNSLENRGNTKVDNSTITGNVANRAGGRFAPGRSPGIATIDGNFTNDLGATLDMEIFGLTPIVEYDVLDVNGTANLGGKLNLIFGFNPALGDQFDILSADAIIGKFDQIMFSGLAPDQQPDVVIGQTGVSVFIEQRLVGDAVPEPTTGLLCVIAFAAMGRRRRNC